MYPYKVPRNTSRLSSKVLRLLHRDTGLSIWLFSLYTLHICDFSPFLSQQSETLLFQLSFTSSAIAWSSNKSNYTYLQNKRMRRCGVAPPPIIFERLKLPQQIIYRRKENLSESPNHQKYWENILVSRFYEQFSRNRRNLGHFRKFEKISNS